MRKRTGILTAIIFTVLALRAQDHVEWAFSKKEVGQKQYELHMTARIDPGWHIYSQVQPENSISVPSSFIFNNGDDFVLLGKVKEFGKLIKFNDSSSGLGGYEFMGHVDFIQLVICNKNAFINFSGTITYQACSDSICLPPKDVQFAISRN